MGTLQIRKVPDELKKKLRARARRRNQTMGEYVLALLEEDLARPEREELLRRLRSLEPIEMAVSAAALLEEARREGAPAGRDNAPATPPAAGGVPEPQAYQSRHRG